MNLRSSFIVCLVSLFCSGAWAVDDQPSTRITVDEASQVIIFVIDNEEVVRFTADGAYYKPGYPKLLVGDFDEPKDRGSK